MNNLPSCSAAGGEIFNQCVADRDEAFKENDVIRLVCQILDGVAYLHGKNIVHLDIKVRFLVSTLEIRRYKQMWQYYTSNTIVTFALWSIIKQMINVIVQSFPLRFLNETADPSKVISRWVGMW